MKIIFTSEALLEFNESINFYEHRKKNLGKRFSNSVKEKLQFILKNPKAAELKYDHVRVAIVPKFPFTIHYFIKNDECVVVAIFHSHRNPEKLKR